MKKVRVMDNSGLFEIVAKILLWSILLLTTPAFAQTQITCIQCHGKLPGKFGEPVKLWQGSIHSVNNVACNDCHGGDPKDSANAMSPERGFIGAPKEKQIPDVCGRCHIGVKRDYLASAHGRALENGGPTCVTCHDNHAVKKATLALINEQSCSRCHSYEKASELKSAMQNSEDLIVTIEQGISTFRDEGVDTETLEKSVFSIRNQFHTLFHDVDVQKVRIESAQINSKLAKLNDSLQVIREERQKRKLIGVFAVGVTLLGALLIYLLKKTYD
jgi:hypothetical protein